MIFNSVINKLCAWRHDMPPRPPLSPPAWAPQRLARRRADALDAVASHAQYVLMVTDAPASRVKAALSKAE